MLIDCLALAICGLLLSLNHRHVADVTVAGQSRRRGVERMASQIGTGVGLVVGGGVIAWLGLSG
jgi:hypothetical protein